MGSLQWVLESSSRWGNNMGYREMVRAQGVGSRGRRPWWKKVKELWQRDVIRRVMAGKVDVWRGGVGDGLRGKGGGRGGGGVAGDIGGGLCC